MTLQALLIRNRQSRHTHAAKNDQTALRDQRDHTAVKFLSINLSLDGGRPMSGRIKRILARAWGLTDRRSSHRLGSDARL